MVLFELCNISKSFNGAKVLENASLTLQPGEIRALVGPNGTGKTVLIRIAAGALEPDAGRILLDGAPVAPNPGIAAIFENTCLLPELTVTENLFLGQEPHRTICGLSYIDWRQARQSSRERLERYGLRTNPDAVVGRLSIGRQRMVEIVRALGSGARVVLVDEPTLFLSEDERQELSRLLRVAAEEGAAFLLLTNRVGEVSNMVDSLSLLRDGGVENFAPAGEPGRDIWDALGADSVVRRYPKVKVRQGGVVLSARRFSGGDRFQDVSFQLHEGEIYGIAGLAGSGARAIGKTIFGLSPKYEGELRLFNRTYCPVSTAKARRSRIGYVSGLNPLNTLVMQENVSFNMTLPNLRRICHGSLLNMRMERELSGDLASRLRIRSRHAERVEFLSGGNQRKVSFGRWIMGNVRLLILEEPTLSMDAVSRLDIYNIINQLALDGVAVLFISSNFQELAGMCDRILVMRNGKPVRSLSAECNLEHEIWRAACGDP